MALEVKLSQKLSQSLLMTPQLQQAIKLLQMGRQEYLEAIQKELLENPVLEELREEDDGSKRKSKERERNKEEAKSKDAEDRAKSDESPIDWENYIERFTDYRGSASAKKYDEQGGSSALENVAKDGIGLVEHLVSQLRMAELPEADRPIALHVIGNLDRNGYLCISYEEICKECDCQIADVERVIEVFRGFDPAGVASRDLGECLLVQLENMGLENSLEAKIVRDHLGKIERRKYDQIAKEENVAVELVYQAVLTIQSLEPRPGRQFADEEVRYVVPDIYVHKVGEEFVVGLNEDGMPKLRISPYYIDFLKKNAEAATDPDSKSYLQERLKAASWLIKSIHQRQQTIFKVTESIVKFQQEFLRHGVSQLKPMVLKTVADDIGMHESTVSRVTTNKYVHTPQGVFELKYFFTTGIKAGGGDVSSSSVKEKIRSLVADENPKSPLSDQKLVDLLEEDGITIARRTVAKYRESLGILSSSKRKKLF